jgi:hypothetical protein
MRLSDGPESVVEDDRVNKRQSGRTWPRNTLDFSTGSLPGLRPPLPYLT